jgi:hypothetical protein
MVKPTIGDDCNSGPVTSMPSAKEVSDVTLAFDGNVEAFWVSPDVRVV